MPNSMPLEGHTLCYMTDLLVTGGVLEGCLEDNRGHFGREDIFDTSTASREIVCLVIAARKQASRLLSPEI